MKSEELRLKYPHFEYKSYSWEKSEKRINFHWTFSAGEFSFTHSESVFLPVSAKNEDHGMLDKLAFHWGLTQLPSYWKAFCSPEIKISAGHLTPSEVSYWHDLYLHGMGEYFYVNGIDFTGPDFLNISTVGNSADLPASELGVYDNVPLVLASEGKDTAVTLGLFDRAGLPFETLTVTDPGIPADIVTGNFPQVMKTRIERRLDPQIRELNSRGYLNGHIPYSAYLAFSGIVTAYLTGHKQLIVNNEASSNEGNVIYLGREINHQYTKSFAFETGLRAYINKSLSLPIEYFSFVRPLYELQITGILKSLPALYNHFTSCNVAKAKKLTDWCGRCPKCLSTFNMLVPFLGLSKASEILGHDLYQDETLIPLYVDLLGRGTAKPFECVSTHAEIIAASYLAMEEYGSLPPMLEYFRANILPTHPNISQETEDLLDSYGPHYLPAKFEEILKSALPVRVK